MAKASKVLKVLQGAPNQTRAEALSVAATTGIAIGTTNSVISQHYIARARTRVRARKQRRIEGIHGMARKVGGN